MRNSTIFSYASQDYNKYLAYINKKNYVFRATLVNPNSMVLDLQKSAIRELSIIDNAYNPFFKGHIIIDNTDNAFERYKSDPTLSEFSNNHQILQSYRVRGDGRDILLLSIIPVDKGKNPYDTNTEDYNKMFGIQIVFVLGDEEDMDSDKYGKVKKFTLIDFDHQILVEKKSFFSSVLLLPNYSQNTSLSFLSDNDRQVETGKMIRYLLQSNLGNSCIDTTVINNKVVPTNFDDGSSKIFYSSPNNNTVMDDLVFLSQHHASGDDNKDYALLNKDQFTGEYTFESVSNVFSKSYNKSQDSGGAYFLENLTIPGGQDVKSVLQNDFKKPTYSLEFGETSDIVDIKFYNAPGALYQKEVKTNLVHTYHFDDKSFKIDATSGNIENVKQNFTDFYVKPMKGKTTPAPNFILNESQKTNQYYENVFTIFGQDDDFIKLAVGRNDLLDKALRLNIGVEITLQGNLHRQSTRFISIDRKGSYIENDFDNKFLGIYYILNIEHLFINDNEFVNKILAVKTYSFVDLENSEDLS